MTLPRWVDAAEAADDSATESEEELEQDDIDQTEHTILDQIQGDITTSVPPRTPNKPGKLSIKLGGDGSELKCHVCGKTGHSAGFVGAIYYDCINKPCYLCGEEGHSTNTCPHRIAPELACKAASDVSTDSILGHLFKREQQGRRAGGHSITPAPGTWAVDAAVLKLHARRTTCLEFHPAHEHLVLSGDKHGQIAVWDFEKVFERTVYTDLNRWLTNSLKFMPNTGPNDSVVATCSYEGTVKLVDVEIGAQIRTLVDANPRGWEHVVEEDKAGTWVTFIGLDVMPSTRTVVAGDSKGRVYFLDERMQEPAAILQAHKKNAKVQSISVNPMADFLVLSAGNDYQARLLDARCLGGGNGAATVAASTSGGGRGGTAFKESEAEVAAFSHPRVINAAYFSPITGRKILTTAQDNRLRVWDDWASNLGADCSRQIVHSHNFNRHLTAFKAEWDPKDPFERLACIGRYISEDYGGVPLHPIDFIDTATGAIVAELADPNLTTICPVNKFHPTKDVLVTGSSRSLYAWKPEEESEEWDDVAVVEAAVAGWAEKNGAGSSGKVGGGAGLQLRGSSNYMFFDADEGAAAKKKRAKSGEASGSGTKTKEKAAGDEAGPSTKRSKKDEAEEEDDDDFV